VPCLLAAGGGLVAGLGSAIAFTRGRVAGFGRVVARLPARSRSSGLSTPYRSFTRPISLAEAPGAFPRQESSRHPGSGRYWKAVPAGGGGRLGPAGRVQLGRDAGDVMANRTAD
jgi:hypothetical protein